jgi:hypothetical protein
MKIGILTMNRIINYGSFLQAYGLQQMLRSLGHEVEFMDIGPEQRSYRQLAAKNPKYRINMLKARIHELLGHEEVARTMRSEQGRWYFSYHLRTQFPRWWKKWLGMDYEDNLNCRYDAVVIGSDEVFNCTQNVDWTASMKWFGEGIEAEKLISYAASFGYTTMQRLEEFGLLEGVKKGLRRMDALSVRDENSRQIALACGAEPVNHLDPVLVYDYESMIPEDKRLKDVMIVYSYQDRLTEESVIRQIKQIARDEGLRLVSLGAYHDWCENPVVSPFEVLRYFKNAKYVVTDTFHGSIFSMKFATPFAAIVRDSNTQKLTDLLQRMGQTEAVVSVEDDISPVLHRTMPAAQLQEKILAERQRTMAYLKENLQ